MSMRQPVGVTLTMALVLGPAVARAHGSGETGDEASLERLIDRADYVFKGRVIDISYRNSKNGAVPHTFVTYAIEAEYKGRHTETDVTLRFVGGPDSSDPAKVQRVTVSSAVPNFDIGDRDILFVRGNTKLACPLVSAKQGRLRLINGQVYSETGQRLIVDDEGDVRRGAAVELDDVDTQIILGQTFVKTRSPKAPPTFDSGLETDHATLTEEEFSLLLSARAEWRVPRSEITRTNPTPQAQPWLDFTISELKTVAPKQRATR